MSRKGGGSAIQPRPPTLAPDEAQEQMQQQLENKLLDSVMFGRLTEVARMLDMGAGIECTDSNGATPLIWASSVGDLKCLLLLLKKGSNINVQDNSGWTPLHHAAWNSHPKVVEILLQRGADPSFRDRSKKKPHQIAKTRAISTMLKKEAQKKKSTSSSSNGSNVKNSSPASNSTAPATISTPLNGTSSLTDILKTKRKSLFGRRGEKSEQHTAASPSTSPSAEPSIHSEIGGSTARSEASEERWNNIEQRELALQKQEQQLRLHKKQLRILREREKEKEQALQRGGVDANGSCGVLPACTVQTPNSPDQQKPRKKKPSPKPSKEQQQKELQAGISVVEWSALKVIKLLGTGAFADVFLAEWRGDLVAVKKLKQMEVVTDEDEDEEKQKSDPKNIETLFMKECNIMSRVRHPNVVLMMGVSTKSPNLAILTELMERGDLYTLLHLQRNKPTTGSSSESTTSSSNDSTSSTSSSSSLAPASKDPLGLDWQKRLQICIDVARGMNYLHTMKPVLVHRDLKTRNILVDQNWRAKVSDFGTSRLKLNQFVNTLNQEGTPAWMAPELLRGEEFDEQVDVFSFGVVLWEIVTGQVPWRGKSAAQIIGLVGFSGKRLAVPSVPMYGCDAAVLQLIQQCFQAPQDRPSFKEILERLHAMRTTSF